MSPRPRANAKNTDDPRGQFGPFLREWIDKNHGGDENRLAETLGMGDRAIRLWMTGDTGPAFKDLGRIARALGFGDWDKLAAAIVRHAKKRG